MQSIVVKQTEKSAIFKTIIDAYINQNFNCKVEFSEDIIVNGKHKNLVLPPVLSLDNENIDLDISDYSGATRHIVEYVLSKNKIKECFKKMELSLISSFLITLYNEVVLESEDIENIKYLNDNYIIKISAFSGFVIFPKETTPVAEQANYPKLGVVEQPKPKVQTPVPAPVDDFSQVVKKSKKKNNKQKVVIDLSYNENDLLLRQPFVDNVNEQKMNYNGWFIKVDSDKKCTAVNETSKLYIPITFVLPECIKDAEEGKEHHNRCKLLFCKRCHNIKAVKAAIETHKRIVKTGNFNDKQIKEDLYCRVLRANSESRCGCDVHDFVSLLENLADNKISREFMFSEVEYNKMLAAANKK